MALMGTVGGERALARDARDFAALPRGILDARVTHVRHQPRPYALSHKLWYLHIGLDELTRLPGALLGYNRGKLYSINDRDYGESGRPLARWIDDAFAAAGCGVPPAGRIALLTMPRIAGFSFNPVSFWLCHDAGGALRAVLAEVNNTFGERHCYLCRKDDASPITARDRLQAFKVFHVSPFLPVDGEYTFRFDESEERLGIFITLTRAGQRILFVSIAGRFAPLTSRGLLARFARAPLPAPLVVLLIHYHAARLYLRGIKLFAKPAPPTTFITPTHPLPDRASELP